jgi:hypothetical protein
MNLRLSGVEFNEWLKVCLIFLAPIILIYGTFVLNNINIDGFAWSDFKPNLFVQGSIVTYILSETLAYFKKLTGK